MMKTLLISIAIVFGCIFFGCETATQQVEPDNVSKSKEIKRKNIAEYLEDQKKSSKLAPKDSLYVEAYELYKKAENTVPYEYIFHLKGTKDHNGIAFLEEAIKINQYYHAGYYALGNSYRQLGENNKAEQHYLKCIELKPKYTGAYYSIATLYEKMKRYNDALTIYYNLRLRI